MPGCMASSTSRTFSAADHRRRRCTEVMTSNREIGPSEGVVIVVIIGLRLCLISYAECPVEKGGSSGAAQQAASLICARPMPIDSTVRLLAFGIGGSSDLTRFRRRIHFGKCADHRRCSHEFGSLQK